MSIKKLTEEQEETVEFFKEFFTPQSAAEELLADAHVLAGYFLVEIEKALANQKLTQKELANRIGTSPSYLSQIFHAERLINFKTLSKIEKALDIKFKIKAEDKNVCEQFENIDETQHLTFIGFSKRYENTEIAS